MGLIKKGGYYEIINIKNYSTIISYYYWINYSSIFRKWTRCIYS